MAIARIFMNARSSQFDLAEQDEHNGSTIVEGSNLSIIEQYLSDRKRHGEDLVLFHVMPERQDSRKSVELSKED